MVKQKLLDMARVRSGKSWTARSSRLKAQSKGQGEHSTKKRSPESKAQEAGQVAAGTKGRRGAYPLFHREEAQGRDGRAADPLKGKYFTPAHEVP